MLIFSIGETVMALRRLLAERVSGLKKAGVELPIINEISIPAKIIRQNYFVVPTGFLDLLRPPAPPPTEAIAFCNGVAEGAEAGRWYRVTYPKSISGAIPVCTARARAGKIMYRAIPKIDREPLREIARTELYWWKCYSCEYPWLTITTRRSSCPQCGSTNIGGPWTGTRAWEDGLKFLFWWGARKGLGDWGLLNWARDSLIKCFEWIGLAMGRMIFALWGGVKNQIDGVRDNIWSAINDRYSKQMEQVDWITDRVNDRLGDLYRMWGIPTNMAITPVHTRNETNTGFDFQSFGDTTISYIVIGGA